LLNFCLRVHTFFWPHACSFFVPIGHWAQIFFQHSEFIFSKLYFSALKRFQFFIDIPLRVNGKVSGSLNGIRLEELDLQCYVVTNDGRTYTAISKVPMELGYDMQSLNVLGTTLGWLFAKPIKSSKNGYELTG